MEYGALVQVEVMAKGCWTIWAGVRDQLKAHGVAVLEETE